MELSMKQEQRQALTPQMELSVRILQMDSMQLTEYLKEVMLENPVIEIEAPLDKSQKENHEELALRKLEWLESQTHREKENVGYYEEDDENTIEKTAAVFDEENLCDHLLKQARIAVNDEDMQPIVQYVIGCLDGNGYLTADLQEMLQETSYPADKLNQAVSIVQGFDPAGIGARNLGECLCLQLAPEDELARTLVTSYLEDLAKNSYAKMAKALGRPTPEIEAAVARIRRLHPKPGSLYANWEPPHYITPDVVVTSFEGRYNVMLCEFGYPEIRLNAGYLQMARETEDKEVTAYIGNKLNQINWIKKCIESRNTTLLSVAKAIVKKQERFFHYGPQYLNILRMKDIAEMIGMHESTVSRAVRDKYLQCAHGVYPLRYFFVKGVDSDGSDGMSSHNVKWEIKQLIEQEDPEKPLSDQQVTDFLNAAGIDISRRTVAKYREEMGIAKSCQRGCRHC